MASHLTSLDSDLTSVAVYERTIHASIERVWENVYDWEHLPWLHASSFRSIELIERGDWGWKARIGAASGQSLLLELVVDGDRYVSRTLEGAGAGTEIWTTLTRTGERDTDIRVEFLLPDVAKAAVSKLGAAMTALYTRLWDEDEAMMQRRSEMLARKPVETAQPLDLGTEREVRARAPFVASAAFGRFRVVEVDGELLAHSTVCAHWLGPLDACAVKDGQITCPWHGYRFDVRTGERRDAASSVAGAKKAPASPMRLARAPRVVIAAGRVRLEAS